MDFIILIVLHCCIVLILMKSDMFCGMYLIFVFVVVFIKRQISAQNSLQSVNWTKKYFPLHENEKVADSQGEMEVQMVGSKFICHEH